MKVLFAILFWVGLDASAAKHKTVDEGGVPGCEAELNDEMNTTIAKISWKEPFYMGTIKGASKPILITTSSGNDRIMSLWVREKVEGAPYGMFSFVDLSGTRDQYMRFYMSDKFSIGVTCRWYGN